jgi:hypothetical protein
MTTTPEVVLAGDAGAKPPSFMPNGPLVRIHANLMPDEIIIARRLHRLQRRLGAGVIALAILLGGGFARVSFQPVGTTSVQNERIADAVARCNDRRSRVERTARIDQSRCERTNLGRRRHRLSGYRFDNGRYDYRQLGRGSVNLQLQRDGNR